MAGDDEEKNKIVRKTKQSFLIEITPDELKYRNKYLPDPRRLTDEKLVCTVCSVHLARKVNSGKDIYVHRFLNVLVCKKCYSFYGDGIFSADEDGDDKYCRWCGQGGTLFICSACNCGFCKKCMAKNMKDSALARVEDDDWKCLICVPRPIFGSRTICWAAQELNATAKKNERLKQRLQEEKLRQAAETKERKSGRSSDSEDNIPNKKRKRSNNFEDDSSPVFIPPKRTKQQTKSKSVNGDYKSHKRKDVSSSESDSSADERASKWEKRKRKKYHRNSASDDSSKTLKKKTKIKDKKTRKSSGESSDNEKKLKVKSMKMKLHKKKQKLNKKREDNLSDASISSEYSKKNYKRRKEWVTNDEMSSQEHKKKIVKNKEKKYTESDKEDTNTEKSIMINEAKDGSELALDTSKLNGSESTPKDDLLEKTASELLVNEEVLEKDTEDLSSSTNNGRCDSVEPDIQNSHQVQNDKSINDSSDLKDFQCEDFDLTYHTSSSDSKSPIDDELEKNIKSAMEWMHGIASDISEVGSLISDRTTRFGDKKVNLEHLKSYEDVLFTYGKVKTLLVGIHKNYNLITNSMEENFIKWKFEAGMENADIDEIIEEENKGSEGCMEFETEDLLSNNAEKNIDNGILGEEIGNEFENGNEDKALVEDETVPKVNDIPDHEEQLSGDNGIETPAKLAQNDSLRSDETQITCELDEISVSETNVKQESVEGVETEQTEVDFAEVEQQLEKDKSAHLEQNEFTQLEKDTSAHPEEDELAQLEKDESEKETEPTIENDCEDEETADCGELLTNKAQLNLATSKQIWSGLLSSDEDSEENEDLSTIDTAVVINNSHAFNLSGDEGGVNDASVQNLTCEKDIENFEALQQMLCSSSDEEPKNSSSDSDSEDTDEIQIDDSDLEINKKPKPKIVTKKSMKPKKKEKEIREKENKEKVNKVEDKTDKNEDDIRKEEQPEDNKECPEEKEKKPEEELDSEAEIEMLTDLTKLKRKGFSRKLVADDNSEESSSESSSEEGNSESQEQSKKRKKYNNDAKKKREEERNELLGFLHEGSSAEDEVDITRDDLDVLEDQYASSSSASMSLEVFSKKMSEKYKELEQEQEDMNLKMLLASDSEEGSVGGDDFVLESDEEKKNKKALKKKEKEEEEQKDEASNENEKEGEIKVEVKEEKDTEGGENDNETNVKVEPDDEYEQFLEDMVKKRPTFKGLGSSSEEEQKEDVDSDDIDIKEEPVSGEDLKIKKEPKNQDSDLNDSSDSSSSGDLFLDLNKRKSLKKKSWRSHKLLRLKLSDTDTSDEERWWQRRLDRERKKKEEQGDRPKKAQGPRKKKSNGSDKENKKESEEEESDNSSTLELSSTESSGSDFFKKKKKKRNASNSDSDVILISDKDKKKKKKKRGRLSGDSSDDSNDSDDDVINISQKSTQGESPGKGGRKNIRKVLTKHELAAATKAAAKEEEERRKRIAARQKLFNEMFEIKEAEILQKLVLDFDPETKTELISVDKDLVVKMKPHQAKGVKFMWDSCFESLSQLKTKKGSGCILAHCMGLGKTFQVISLVHTILTHKDTNVNTVLVVCPLSTVLNWYGEFGKWLDDVRGGRDIKVYHLTKYKKAHERARQLSQWQRTGGVLIIGYEMFRILTNETSKKFRLIHKEAFQKTLIDPGADLVVCDEGHMLKNESTILSKAMSRIKTLRRIVLTGTPMQNNLKEYHCMVQFVKPNLLGTRKEFLNQFVNPITNGQFVDSTEADVKVMKRRAHVLHKMLEGLVQRFDYSVLTPFLPPKHEYVVSLRLSDVQVKLYQFYLEQFSQQSTNIRTGSQLFQDWQALGRIWTHPRTVKMSTDKAEKEREKKKAEESEEESMKNFIDDKSSSSLSLSSSHSSSSDNETGEKKEKKTKKKKKDVQKNNEESAKPKKSEELKIKETDLPEGIDAEINLISSDEEEDPKNEESKSETVENENVVDSDINAEETKVGDESLILIEDATEDAAAEIEKQSDGEVDKENKAENDEDENEKVEETKSDKEEENKEEKEKEEKKKTEVKLDRHSSWWKDIIEPHHLEDINQSAKLILLFAILRECEMIEDKVLVFSQSLFSLDLIEYFLEKVHTATEENRLDESLGGHAGCWTKGLDYFRLDGSVSSENRSAWCKTFNREDNTRARLFLISTRAGGLGINLTAANRVVIFDASWNPSHDVQSIFRIYRFGQKKPCYVYRFIAHGTMEEKVYDRQVAKQSLSSRVVDEQQVHRHFSMNDLNELYNFTPPGDKKKKEIPALPKDRLMAELLTQYSDWIEKYHEHDSLLENILEEELNEEERKLAWEDYENDKKKGFLPVTPGVGGTLNSNAFLNNQLELFRKSLRLKYPSASEQEMNAMLQTLMYQVNINRIQAQAQMFTGAQQPQGQQNPSTSQANAQTTFRNIQPKLSPQQMFNMQRNHLYQKYGQMVQQQQKPGQRIGNGQIKQNMTIQRITNNLRTTDTNKVQANTSSGNYMDQMRQQQEANLRRLQSQRVMQQQRSQTTMLNSTQRSQPQTNKTFQPNLGAQQNQQSVLNRQQPIQNRQQPIQNRQQPIQNRQQPVQNQRQSVQNRQQLVQNRQVVRNSQVSNPWKTNQPLVNQNRTQLQKQVTPTRLLNNSQLQVTRVGKPAPAAAPIGSAQKLTPQQMQQQQMRQRISALQQQKKLQQRTQQRANANNSLAIQQQQKLEEMKKRYNASRKNTSSGVSIVEIDDEPSGSGA